MKNTAPGDRPLTVLAHLIAPAGVVLVILSFVLLVLQGLGYSSAGRSSSLLAGGLGAAGLFLLWTYLRLDWSRVMRAPAAERGPVRAQIHFGPGTPTGAVTRNGSVSVEDGRLLLRYREVHQWLLWTSYTLLMTGTHLEIGAGHLAGTLATFLPLLGYLTVALLGSRVHRREFPLEGIRLVVVDALMVRVHLGSGDGPPGATLVTGKRDQARLRELLGDGVPVEVLPPPARAPRVSRPAGAAYAPAPPPPPPPPRRTLDARKVKELDSSLRGLDRLNQGRPLPPRAPGTSAPPAGSGRR